MAVYKFLQLHPGAPPEQWPGRLSWVSISGFFFDSAWKTAQQSDVLQYMPRAEVLLLDELLSGDSSAPGFAELPFEPARNSA